MGSLMTEVLMKDHFAPLAGSSAGSSPRLDGQARRDSSYQRTTNNPTGNGSSTRQVAFQPPDHYRKYQQHYYYSSAQQPPKAMSQGSARASSPDGSSTSGEKATSTTTAKTGRKGDPRMHRAVAARLAEPNMTLFDALKAGGFDYPDDNNPNCVDAENITLAQRKNQLSRRLRIARRAENFLGHPPPSASDSKNKFESLVEKQKQSFQMMQQKMELERRSSAGQYAASGQKRARSGSSNQNVGTHASLLDEDDDNNNTDAQQPPPMMAKYHPQFHHILVPPAGLHYAQSAPSLAGLHGNSAGGGMFFPNPSFQIPNMAPSTAAGGMASAGQGNPNGNSGAAAASGVAINSLTRTAQSVGLSLEQLALALSSTSNLAQVVLGEDADDKDPGTAKERKKKKHDLALQLYRHESRPVYARCMMLAGFKPEMTQENSKEYLKFAWQAWQREGRRLRNLLEENDMLVEDAPVFHGEGGSHAAKKQRAEQDENVRSSTRSCHTEDGRHIHRIEKCGHKAILHHPKDGEAHIDFVVGDKVECYEGIGGREVTAWPSQYHCDRCEINTSDSETPKENAPKVLDLHTIDLGGGEWNVDFVDDTLHGLVRLGEDPSTPVEDGNKESFVVTEDSFTT